MSDAPDVKKEIKSYLNQAEVYKAQGLIQEAMEKYSRAGKLIMENTRTIGNHKSLLNSISKKINALKKELHQLQTESPAQEMSEQVQEVIKTKFVFSKEADMAELEGAIALARFGQYAKALEELKIILSQDRKETIRLEAAKNVVRCHSALDALPDAVKVFRHWAATGAFPPDQLEILRAFLQKMLSAKGMDIPLSDPGMVGSPETGMAPPSMGDEVILDVSSVGITLTEGSNKGRTLEYDISFQSGNLVNLLITDRDRDLLEAMEPGCILEQVQFFSPMAMFDGKAEVISKSKIESGPKQGHFSVDIKIMSI